MPDGERWNPPEHDWLNHQDDELDEHDRFGDVPDYTPQLGADPDAESSHSGRALESTTRESTP